MGFMARGAIEWTSRASNVRLNAGHSDHLVRKLGIWCITSGQIGVCGGWPRKASKATRLRQDWVAEREGTQVLLGLSPQSTVALCWVAKPQKSGRGTQATMRLDKP